MTNKLRMRRRIKVGPPRLRRRSRRRWIIAGLAGAAAVAAPAIALVTRTKPAPCYLVIAADRSLSANLAKLNEERTREANLVLDRYANCETVFMASINAKPGQAWVWTGPLRGHGTNPFDTGQRRDQNLKVARTQVAAMFASPATKGTNIVQWFRDAAAALGELPRGAVVHAYLYTDGMNTVGVNVSKEIPRGTSMAEVVRTLAPLPRLSAWEVHFVGVNRTVSGGVSVEAAQRAQIFWEAFVKACGGALVEYAPA